MKLSLIKIEIVHKARRVWAHTKHILRSLSIKVWYYLTFPFRPIYVEEGAIMPRWYGYSRFVPVRMETKYNETTYKWERVAFIVPLNLIINFFYWTKWKIWYGCRLDPQCYQNRYFKITHRCPHCKEDLIPRHFWPKDVLQAVEEEEEEGDTELHNDEEEYDFD